VQAQLSVVESDEVIEAPASGPEPMPLRPAGRGDFQIAGEGLRLTGFWIDVYGGGVFLPFCHAACPADSSRARRCLFYNVKSRRFESRTAGSADPAGYAGGEITLDFNYAYNPSCAYDERWACPLAPRENWLGPAIRAGERKFHD